MLCIESSVARIEAVLKKVPRRQLALAAGITPANLREAGTPDWNPTRRTLTALERAIQNGIVGAEMHANARTKHSRNGRRI